jgi:hypothetical protein
MGNSLNDKFLECCDKAEYKKGKRAAVRVTKKLVMITYVGASLGVVCTLLTHGWPFHILGESSGFIVAIVAAVVVLSTIPGDLIFAYYAIIVIGLLWAYAMCALGRLLEVRSKR